MWILVCFLLAVLSQAAAHALRAEPGDAAQTQVAAVAPTQPLNVYYRKATGSDLTAVAALRCRVFCPYLTSIGSQYLQQQGYVEAMRSKSAVLVALEAAYDDADDCSTAAASETAEEGGVAGGTIDQRRGRGTDVVSPVQKFADASSRAALIVGSADLVQAHDCCYVTNVCVASRARRQGIGRGLMQLAADIAVEDFQVTNQLLHVESHNDAAIRLYDSIGFEPIEECDEAAPLSAAEAYFTGKYLDNTLPKQQMLRKALRPRDT